MGSERLFMDWSRKARSTGVPRLVGGTVITTKSLFEGVIHYAAGYGEVV
jgi:hypothetical protein